MDDLTKIKGLGAAAAEKLRGIGVESYAQIAALTDDQILQLNDDLGLRGSIINDDWRGQAAALMQPASPSGGNGPELVQDMGTTKAPGGLMAMRVNRDFWDAAGERHRKGTIVEVSVEDAMDGVESGALSRAR